MKERLIEFLKNENKSSAQLAEEIGVQPSGISHILSGRNNPSLDFVLKMLNKYKFLSTDWLLFGTGSMYREAKMQTLFDLDQLENTEQTAMRTKNDPHIADFNYKKALKSEMEENSDVLPKKTASDVVRIVWFYENDTFEEFFRQG